MIGNFVRLKNGLIRGFFKFFFIFLLSASTVSADNVQFTAPHHPLDRVLTEIHFARQLVTLYPEKAGNWENLIQQSENLIYNLVATADQTKVNQSIQEAEKIMAKLSLSKGKTISDMKRLELKTNGSFKQFIAKANFYNYYMPNYQSRRDLNRAKNLVYDEVSHGKERQILEAVRQAENILSPIGKIAKSFTLHCIGHAHIDMNWQWTWGETVGITNDTFTTVLKLMEEFPDFHFSQSQISVYELIKRYNPELFAQIKKRVAEGRWEITASQWVEGDKNMASGESLVRHLLYSRSFIKENFNLNPEDVAIDWEPDTFGHSRAIPTIMSRGSVKYYYFCRGGAWDKPSIFWWQGPDGSRLLANFEKESWYNGSIGTHNALWALDFYRETGLKDWMNVYGVGDHGGGPTRLDIRRCIDMNSWPIFPNFRMTTTKKYYELIEKSAAKFPVLDKELNFEFTGCYTSQSQIKMFNRFAENQTQEAETAATLSYLILNREYPMEMLRESWRNLLFSHFHDILPGSNTHLSREYQSGLAQECFAITSMVKSNNLRAIANHVNTSFTHTKPVSEEPLTWKDTAMGAGAGRGTIFGGTSAAGHIKSGSRAVVVFNPNGWPRNDVITVSLWETSLGRNLEDIQDKQFIIRLSNGRVIPAQKIAVGGYWGHGYLDIAFPVSIDALGYNSYVIEEGETQESEPVVHFLSGSDKKLTLESDVLLVDFDRTTGGISKLIEKKSGVNFADTLNPLATLEYLIEDGGNAWVIAQPKQKKSPLRAESVTRKLNGPYVASVVAKYKLNESTINITYTLKAGLPWINIKLETMWLEKGSPQTGTPTLRMLFPYALNKAVPQYEIPYGSIERKLNSGEEVPCLRWADVTGDVPGGKRKAGCVLLNDSKYGHALLGSSLRLTLLRSSFTPDPLPEMGKHTMNMAIAPHGKILPVHDFVHYGADFNHPLQVINTEIHNGILPSSSAALISGTPSNIVLSAIKKAEGDGAIILRLYETDGMKTTAKLKINTSILGNMVEADEVDLLERILTGSSLRRSENIIKVDVPAFGITSMRIRFEKSKM